jgi:hypothetical protein
MTDRSSGRRRHVASVSRVLAAGLSTSATFAIVGGLALAGAPAGDDRSSGDVSLDPGPAAIGAPARRDATTVSASSAPSVPSVRPATPASSEPRATAPTTRSRAT